MKLHWREYAIEAFGLGAFMVSACVFGTLLEHPASPAHAIAPELRRAAMGLAMGLTAVAIIYSPWGRRSGAHINPSVTLTFWFLGRVEARDAVAYVGAQMLGGIVGVGLAAALLGPALADSAVNYVATVPGIGGVVIAWPSELLISFILMSVVLASNARPRVAPYTGVLCGCLAALYITFEAPLSGMSMNPARTLGSALFAGRFDVLWIYFSAPPLGMVLAAVAHVKWAGAVDDGCAKLRHDDVSPCIFCLSRQRRQTLVAHRRTS